MKQTIIRTGLETLYFSGLHHFMRPLVGGVGAILTLHHVRPPRPDAFQPNHLLEVTPEFLERLLRRLKRAALDVISLDEMHARYHQRRFQAPLRLHHLRRRLQGSDALCLSVAEEIPAAVRALHPDQLSRPARRIVVGRARSGDRAEQPHRHGDQRQGPVLRVRHGEGKARSVRPGLWLSAQHEDRGRTAPRGARPVRLPPRRYRVVLPRPVHGLAGDHRSRRRSAGHHRRAHRQPHDAQEDGGRSPPCARKWR